MRADSSSGYELWKGGILDYDSTGYLDFPCATRYPAVRSPQEMKIPNRSYGSAFGTGGYSVNEVAPRFRDPHSVGSALVDDIRGSSDHLNLEQNTFRGFGSSFGRSSEAQQSAYHHTCSVKQSGCQNYNAQGSYSSVSPSQLPFQNVNPHQAPYRSINMEQQPCQHMSAQGSYHY